MLICIDQRTGTGCGAENRDRAKFCGQCGKTLRFALGLRDPGTMVRNYRIVRMLGHGGFGAVYEALDVGTQQAVALKETFDSDSIRSFEREFAVLKGLEHPHLPRYYDMFVLSAEGKEGERNAYLVMELVPGQNLAEVLAKQGQLLETQVLGYALQLCDVLSFLHRQIPQILHRDIKPANIRLMPEGIIKLVDFGLLKVGRTTRRALSPPYAALEQWGGGTNVRSDLYSLGATLYHLLTGKEPLPAPDRIVASPDPLPLPQTLNANLSQQVADSIMTAMGLRQQERYANAMELKQALLGVRAPAVTANPIPFQLVFPPALPANAPPTEPTTTLVVSKARGSKYKTIGAAIKDAPRDARILIRPGLYKESLVLDKPLELVGDGPRAEIIIEGKQESCLKVSAERAAVRGLTIRAKAPKKKEFYGVDITEGEVLLEDCDISSNSLSCIAIHGANAKPIIRRCTIHDGNKSGILIWKNGKGLIEECDFFANGHAGIAITQGGSPIVRNCRLYKGKQGGIYVWGNGLGRIENCDIFGNSYAGVMIRQGGNPLIRKCKIHENKLQGINIYEDGRGTIEDCEIFANTDFGMEIKQGSKPIVRRCKVYEGQKSGILVWSRAESLIEECDIFANKFAGIAITQEGNPLVRGCQIHDGKQGGIYIWEKGLGTIEECNIFGNTYAGIMLRGGNPIIRRCEIHDGQESGIYIYQDGQGMIEDCNIFSNTEYGIEIKEKANPVILRCSVHQSKKSGILIWKNGNASIEECDIFDNRFAGIAITQGGNPIIRRCKIHDGQQGGVYVWSKGEGRVEASDIFNNTFANVMIKEKGNPIILRCQIYDGQDDGIYVYEEGKGIIQECDIFSNASSGIQIKDGASPTVRGCRINSNSYQAITMYQKSFAYIEDCDLTNNGQGAWYISPESKVKKIGNQE